MQEKEFNMEESVIYDEVSGALNSPGAVKTTPNLAYNALTNNSYIH